MKHGASWLLSAIVILLAFCPMARAEDCDACYQKCEDDLHGCIQDIPAGLDQAKEQEEMAACGHKYEACRNACASQGCKAPAKPKGQDAAPSHLWRPPRRGRGWHGWEVQDRLAGNVCGEPQRPLPASRLRAVG